MSDDGGEHIYKYFKANITYIYFKKIFMGGWRDGDGMGMGIWRDGDD